MKDFNTYFSITDRSREWKISKYKKVWNNLMKKSDLLKLVEKTKKKYTLLNYMLSIHLLKSFTEPYIKQVSIHFQEFVSYNNTAR